MNHLITYLIEKHSSNNEHIRACIESLTESHQSGSSCMDLIDFTTQNNLDADAFIESLDIDHADSIFGSATSDKLIIYSKNALYFHRYFQYEKNLSEALKLLTTPAKNNVVLEAPDLAIDALFESEDAEPSDQQLAAECALNNQLTIIAGGPGTGKTTTVVKILALLRSTNAFDTDTDVLLCAPTGKAADRLKRSINQGVKHLAQSSSIDIDELYDLDDLPSEASTIHRALKFNPQKNRFTYNRTHKLPHYVVVIDEASMIDLSLMTSLLSAIREDAKVIILGDHRQLSSVDVGSVMADLTYSAEQPKSLLSDCFINLRKTYRNTGAIKMLCDDIKRGDADRALEILHSDEHPTTTITPLPRGINKQLKSIVRKYWLDILKNNILSCEEKLTELNRFRILCPYHDGLYGVTTINNIVSDILAEGGIDTSLSPYIGQSIIIQQNDHHIPLYNGDVGIITERGAYFGGEDDDKFISPVHLPNYTASWALTIHKTQGSEYDHILLILPDGENNLLTRELIYTAVSRAKKSVSIWSGEETLTECVAQQVRRASGLPRMLAQ